MDILSAIWSWITSAVTQGLNMFNNMLSNSWFAPIFELFLVVFAIGCIFQFIIFPFIGHSKAGSADKAGDDK